MADMFGRQTSGFGGAMVADGAKITFAMGELAGGVGLLCQGLNVQYVQQVSRIFEIGSDRHFYIVGRAQGNLTMQRILGPRAVQLAFYTRYGDACRAGDNVMEFSAVAGCDTAGAEGRLSFRTAGVLITSFGLQVNANDLVVNEALGMMFTSLAASN